MAAEINLFLAENETKVDTGQAIGFFAEQGFGDPLSVGEYNSRTYAVGSSGGTPEVFEADNNKFRDISGVIVGQTGSGILLTQLPNFLSSINIRFSNTSSAVRTQNAFMRIHSGDKINAPSGMTILSAEIIHTNTAQDNTGVGDSQWLTIAGSGSELGLVDSPGTSGFSPFGPATTDTRHDWYVAMSVKPDLPGDKVFHILVQLEYL